MSEGLGWAERSPVERALITGIHGAPEIKGEERKLFLGELKERVLAALTRDQVGEPSVDGAVERAAADPRAKAIIVHGDLFAESAPYRQLAAARGLSFTMRSDPAFRGEVGLVVVGE